MGADGDDILTGNAGTTTINGNNGNDTLYAGPNATVLHGGAGTNALYGGVGNDLLYVEGTGDQVYGGDGDDVIILNYYATAGAVIDGGAGSNVLNGYCPISGAMITKVQTLDMGAGGSVTFTAAQLADFFHRDHRQRSDRPGYNLRCKCWDL